MSFVDSSENPYVRKKDLTAENILKLLQIEERNVLESKAEGDLQLTYSPLRAQKNDNWWVLNNTELSRPQILNSVEISGSAGTSFTYKIDAFIPTFKPNDSLVWIVQGQYPNRYPYSNPPNGWVDDSNNDDNGTYHGTYPSAGTTKKFWIRVYHIRAHGDSPLEFDFEGDTWRYTYDSSAINFTEFEMKLTGVQANRRPIFRPIPNQTLEVDQELQYQLVALDPDEGDELIFRVISYEKSNSATSTTYNTTQPIGTLDASSGLFQWTPTAIHEDAKFKITFNVSDSKGLSAQNPRTMIITVNPLPEVIDERPLGVYHIPNYTRNTNQTVTFTVEAFGGTPPYTFTRGVGGNTSGLTSSINSSTGVFTATKTSAGTTNFAFDVSDSSTPNPQRIFITMSVTWKGTTAPPPPPPPRITLPRIWRSNPLTSSITTTEPVTITFQSTRSGNWTGRRRYSVFIIATNIRILQTIWHDHSTTNSTTSEIAVVNNQAGHRIVVEYENIACETSAGKSNELDGSVTIIHE